MSCAFARRRFLRFTARTAACLTLGALGLACSSSSTDNGETQEPPVAGYPIAPNAPTTLESTVKASTISGAPLAKKDLEQVSQYGQYGYGAWTDGGPLAADKRSDLMADGYQYPPAASQTLLANFFTFTDIHITDKESPSQLLYMQPLAEHGFEATATSAYSPVMLYTTHVLDAAVQTVNALHQREPFDFGLSLGDTCNSTQYNELRWYVDVLDGKVITPSSGAHVGADSIDYQKPYQAAGLDPGIPWYQTLGNHDHFWLGSIPVEAADLAPSYTSSEVLSMGNALANGSSIYDMAGPLFYMGVIDGSTPNGDIVKGGKVGDSGFTSPPTVVPDPDRRSLSREEWRQEFFNTTSSPVGHGFNLVPPGQDAGFACYSFLPKSSVPLKVIVLDDTQSEMDGAASIHGRGFLDEARWTWLKKELADGDAAGHLMIIASHVPIGVMPPASLNGGSDTYMDWYDSSAEPAMMQNAVAFAGLLAELHSHPNLLMWIAGHRHVNTVKAFYTDDPTRPERGFWHVETSSLRDFPQQLRQFEINLNSDYTIAIKTTNVDPAVQEGTPAFTARTYAVAAFQIIQPALNPNVPGADPTTLGFPTALDPSITLSNAKMDANVFSYNAELFKQLSPDMIAKMQSLFPAQ